MLPQFAFFNHLKTTGILIFFIVFLSTACQEEKATDKDLSADLVDGEKGVPIMTFEETKFDFGKITEGEKVSHVFQFTNTGDGDLVISAANASCGCTVPEYPKEPIKPGGKGKILVTFDSKGKEGVESKSIEVRANTTPPSNNLTISAEIVKPTGK